MSWLKSSDASHMHPVVLQGLEHPDADDRTLNELFGCFARCAAYVAAFEGDYVIRMGPFKQIAGLSRAKPLIEQGVAAGYVTVVALDDGSEALRLVEDEDLFNMIPRTARDWARQRDADRRNTLLTAPVRLRDGDGCRYCGTPVIWGDQRGNRGGTYDHVIPGKAATIETYVVACRTCNSSRKQGRKEFDREHPLLDPPARPYYSRKSVEFLAEHGIAVEPTDGSRTTTPVQAYGTATAAAKDSAPTTVVEHTLAQQDVVPDPAAVETPHGPSAPPDWAGPPKNRPKPPNRQGGELGSAGSGRDGPGRAGSGREPRQRTPPDPSDPPCPKNQHAQTQAPEQGRKRRRRRRRR